MPHIIAIMNQKGGTGKTTTTVNLGAALAKMGKKVLILDLDPQGNLGFCFGIHQYSKSMTDVMFGDVKIKAAIIEKENLHIIPSDMTLADVEISLAQHHQREFILKSRLSEVIDYDYVFMDCSPSVSLITINALVAAHRIIVPLQLEVLALQGLNLVIETIFKIKETLNPQLNIMGVLPVMVDKRRKITYEIFEYLKNNFGIPIFQTTIFSDVKAVEAPSFGESIIKYAPQSIAAQGYMSFAEEVNQLLNSNG
ncbi:MAG: AAA family ATPase [Flammeovirgaceae bacterium]